MRGHQYGLAEQQHQQQLEDNKLRSALLKHELDRIKIQDQLSAREVARQNLALQEGQPEAELPHESFTQPNLPSRSYAGAMGLPGALSSMLRDQVGADTSTVPETPPAPETMAAPAAQATTPGTNSLGSRIAPVTIPGVDAYGVGPVGVRPRSLEEKLRESFLAKYNEPYTLSPGARRFIGDTEVGRGAPVTRSVGAGGLAETDASGKTTLVVSPRPPTPPRPPAEPLPTDVLLDGEPAKVVWNRDKRAFTDLQGNVIDNSQARIRPIRGAGSRSANPDTESRLQYDEFFKNYTRRYPVPSRADEAAALAAGQEPPTRPPSPPSLEKWSVMTPEERAGVLANPVNRIDDAEATRRMRAQPAAARPTKATQASAVPDAVTSALKGKAPNKRYKLSDGSTWDVLADGTIRPGPTQ